MKSSCLIFYLYSTTVDETVKYLPYVKELAKFKKRKVIL